MPRSGSPATTVHSYGPAVGRMDVRSEVAEFFNRDGLLDYPDSEVRFQPDEVLFTPGTRAGLAIVLEVLGADGSGVVVPRPSWEYDWFIERAGKRVVELPTTAPEFLPDPRGARAAARQGRHLIRHRQQSAQPDRPRLPAGTGRGTGARGGEASLLRALRLRLPAARLRRLVRQSGVRASRVARLGGVAVRPVQDGHVRRVDRRASLLDGDLRPDPVERRARPRDPRQPLGVAGRDTVHAGPGLGARRAAEPAGGAAPAVAVHARAPRLHAARRPTSSRRSASSAPTSAAPSTRRSPSRAWSASRSTGCATACTSAPW